MSWITKKRYTFYLLFNRSYITSSEHVTRVSASIKAGKLAKERRMSIEYYDERGNRYEYIYRGRK